MRLTCTINGEPREVDGLWEGESLLHVLRERLGLPGAKNACEQGECGSCSVYLDGTLVCSCLVLAGQAEGREIVTVEGLAPEGELSKVQEAFLAAGAVQCGFCTPGLIVATDDLLKRNPDPDRRGDPRGAGRQPVPLHGLREDPRRGPGGGAMTRLVIEGCAIATVDDVRTRAPRRAHRRPPRLHRRGRRRPGAGGRGRGGPHRRPRPARHARPRQLPPPPLPVGHARARAGQHAVRVAAGALSGLVARRRRDRAGRRPRRAGRARALGLHDRVRPPLPLPARRRRPARGRDRGGARGRAALPPLPRLDGPRPQPGRAAARRGRRGPRRDPRRLQRRDRPLPRHLAGRDGADRARAVLAVLRHRRS